MIEILRNIEPDRIKIGVLIVANETSAVGVVRHELRLICFVPSGAIGGRAGSTHASRVGCRSAGPYIVSGLRNGRLSAARTCSTAPASCFLAV